MSPGFIIVGAQKSGTTYLYNLLIQHPDILAARQKEIHYFDLNFNKGDHWYLNHFPYKLRNKNKISGEASPYYLYHPLVAKRIFEFNGKIKIIILLRNPSDRAISHINMIKNKWKLEIDLKDICTPDKEILIQDGLNKKIIRKNNYNSKIHQHFSFISRGIYYKQIERYLKYFDLNKNILIINSEDLFANTKKEFEKTTNFLNLSSSFDFINFKINKFEGNYRLNDYQKCKEILTEFYKNYNYKLEQIIGKKMNWD